MLLQKLQFLHLSEAAGITHSCVDSAREGRGGSKFTCLFAERINTLYLTHRFASSAVLKIPQQTYTSAGSDSLSCAVELVTYPSLIIHKSLMYKYYVDALERTNCKAL